MRGEGEEGRAWLRDRTQHSRDSVTPGKGQDRGWDRDGDQRVGLEEGPAVGGAGWVLRGPQQFLHGTALASPWSPERGGRGAHAALPPCCSAGAGPGGLRTARGEGQPRGWLEMDGTDLGTVGKGQERDSPRSLCQPGMGL